MRTILIITLFFASLLPANDKTLIIGVENIHYYPYYDFASPDKASFTKELFARFAKENGYTIHYEALPIKRLLLNLLKDKIDLKFPDNAYWATDIKGNHNVIYSDPIVPYTDGTMVIAINRGKVDINILGTVMGFTPWNYLEKIQKGDVSVLENAGFHNLLKQTLMNRVDGAYVNIDVARHHLKTDLNMPGALVFDPALPHTNGFYHLSTIKRGDVIKKFNAFLTKNAAYLEKLQKKYNIITR